MMPACRCICIDNYRSQFASDSKDSWRPKKLHFVKAEALFAAIDFVRPSQTVTPRAIRGGSILSRWMDRARSTAALKADDSV